MSRFSLEHFAFAALLTVAGAAVGCNEEVAAPPGIDLPFSMYGVLTPDRTTQSVLVFPIYNRLTDVPDEPLDAVVTSTDLTTGEVREWKDSLVASETGRRHVFSSDFKAEYGRSYRIKARRSDGAESWAEVRVPDQVTVDHDSSTSVEQVVHIRGEDLRAMKTTVEYTVRYYHPADPPEKSVMRLSRPYLFPYEARQVAGGWDVSFRMQLVCPTLAQWVAEDEGDVLTAHAAMISLRLTTIVGDTLWNPPGGNFDPNVLSLPGVMNNVQNGYGFIGGGYILQRYLYPTRVALERAGYVCLQKFSPVLCYQEAPDPPLPPNPCSIAIVTN